MKVAKSLTCTFLFTTILCTSGCGLVTRSNQATNLEDEFIGEEIKTTEETDYPKRRTNLTPTATTAARAGFFQESFAKLFEETPAQKNIGANSNSDDEAELLINQASTLQNQAEFSNAHQIWTDYLQRFAAHAQYSHALYQDALCLLHLRQYVSARDQLKTLIEMSDIAPLAVNARLLLAQCLIELNEHQSALALTYEILADTHAEKNTGFKRIVKPWPTTQLQKVKLYALRAVALSNLDQTEISLQYLKKARLTLDQMPQNKLAAPKRKQILAQLALKEIQTLSIICEKQNTPLKTIDEKSFLNYAAHYYECFQPAIAQACTVQAAYNAALTQQLHQHYKEYLEQPLNLIKNLPAPARKIKKTDQPFFERELKDLIQTTVDQQIKPFRFITKCGVKDAFYD